MPTEGATVQILMMSNFTDSIVSSTVYTWMKLQSRDKFIMKSNQIKNASEFDSLKKQQILIDTSEANIKSKL